MEKDKFSFEAKGKKYEIPSFSEIPMGAIRKARKLETEIDQVFTIIEEVMGEGSKELDALDTLNQAAFAQFVIDWTQGAPLGESSSSES